MADNRQGIDASEPARAAEEASGPDYKVYVVADRSFEIVHPDGHRWNLQVPDGHAGGPLKDFAPIRWANDTVPDDPTLTDTAHALAMEEAKRRGWL